MVLRAGGHDGAQQIAVLCGVLLVTPGSWLPALTGWSRSPTRTESQYGESGYRGQKIIKDYPSLANAPFFLAILNAHVCSLAISISLIFVTHFLAPCSSPAHSCTRSLACEIREPIGRCYAEVGSASLLIPPLEWITKWK